MSQAFRRRSCRHGALAPTAPRLSLATCLQPGQALKLHTLENGSRRTSFASPALASGSAGPLQQGVAVVIVDHGSRKKDSNEMLVEFGKLYEQVTGCGMVEVAHMEIAEPTIEQAVGELGCGDLVERADTTARPRL